MPDHSQGEPNHPRPGPRPDAGVAIAKAFWAQHDALNDIASHLEGAAKGLRELARTMGRTADVVVDRALEPRSTVQAVEPVAAGVEPVAAGVVGPAAAPSPDAGHAESILGGFQGFRVPAALEDSPWRATTTAEAVSGRNVGAAGMADLGGRLPAVAQAAERVTGPAAMGPGTAPAPAPVVPVARAATEPATLAAMGRWFSEWFASLHQKRVRLSGDMLREGVLRTFAGQVSEVRASSTVPAYWEVSVPGSDLRIILPPGLADGEGVSFLSLFFDFERTLPPGTLLAELVRPAVVPERDLRYPPADGVVRKGLLRIRS